MPRSTTKLWDTPHYEVLTARAAAALAVLRLHANPGALTRLFSRMPIKLDRPFYSTLNDVDSGLLCREAFDRWLFTPHGGSGVMAALEATLKEAGFRPLPKDHVPLDARAQLWRFLAKIPSRGQAEIALRLVAESGPEVALARLEDLSDELLRLPAVYLMGAPNAGKSSLFNALGSDRQVIVSEVAGTTRDVIEGRWHLGDGFEVRLFDSPGLRDDAASLGEKAGIQLVQGLREMADMILWLVAPEAQSQEREVPAFATLALATKADLADSDVTPKGPALRVSAQSGAGLEELAAEVRRQLFPRLLSLQG